MTAPRRPRAPKATPPRVASVLVERNGACIRIDDVPLSEAGAVLEDLLTAFRAMQAKFPELLPDLGSVGAGSPVTVEREYYATDSRTRRVGFSS